MFDSKQLEKLKSAGLITDEAINAVNSKSKPKKEDKRPKQQDNKPNQQATAPYNFIPLAGKAVNSPLGEIIGSGESFGTYVEEQGKLTGYIDLELTTLTPLCINDGGSFYSPNGNPVIPGSTLRGMIKNYLKIISCGTMRAEGNEDLTSRHLYYRDIASAAGTSSLKAAYKSKVLGKDAEGKECVIAKPGFLVKRCKEKDYVIYPAEVKWYSYPRKKDSQGNEEYLTLVDKQGNVVYKEDGITPIRIYKYIIPRKKEAFLEYKCLQLGNGKNQSSVFGVACHTCPMGQYPGDSPSFRDREFVEKGFTTQKSNAKHHFCFIQTPDWNTPIDVPDKMIEDYRADKHRKGFDLLKDKNDGWRIPEFLQGNNYEKVVPCFYIVDEGNNLLNFGYGKYYRIPYDMAIEDHIPSAMRDKYIIDFAVAIFGRKEDFAGRVFFEDAVYQSGELLPKEFSHNLMEPRPTSFQLYLEQKQKGPRMHWDDNTNIRGYKLYWHQAIGARDWHRGAEEKEVKGTVKIEPITKNSVFKGCIRFENLSQLELGVLLASLDMGTKGCFKLGMGKSIGMGSVKTTFQLHVFDLQTRYSTLFDNEKWQLGDNVADATQYEKAFNDYMQDKIVALGIKDSYDKSMEALEIMMSWDAKPSQDQLKYMPIGDRNDKRYQNRIPLPTPAEVVKLPKGAKK